MPRVLCGHQGSELERDFTYIDDIVQEATAGEGGKTKLQRLNDDVLCWCCGSRACVDERGGRCHVFYLVDCFVAALGRV